MTRATMSKEQKARKNGQHHNGRWIAKRDRLAIYLRDRFTCLYCLKDMHDAHPTDITLDHVVPRSSAGAVRDSKNLVTCCRNCNVRKRDLPLDRFAGPETISHIKRNCRRAMAKYVRLANAILTGQVSPQSDA